MRVLLLVVWAAPAIYGQALEKASTKPFAQTGLRYEHRVDEGPLSLHILEIDASRVRILPVRALNDGLGVETVASMARRKGAVGAVNGGFFSLTGRYVGIPSGILKIGTDWYASPSLPRGAIGWNRQGSDWIVGRLLVSWELRAEESRFAVSRLNRPRGAAQAVLYTWAFHRSTLTGPGGREFLLQDKRVIGVGKGDSQIPPHGFVYSVGPQGSLPSGLVVGSRVLVQHRFEPQGESEVEEARQRWEEMDFIVGGTPVLIRNGRLVEDFSPERVRATFVTGRHPRTALGIRPDGTWIVLVVDGRKPALSVGMTLKELGELLLSLGCVDALNLDGGGSSTLFYDGEVRNSPADLLGERAVSDAILFFTRGEVEGEGN